MNANSLPNNIRQRKNIPGSQALMSLTHWKQNKLEGSGVRQIYSAPDIVNSTRFLLTHNISFVYKNIVYDSMHVYGSVKIDLNE